MTPITVVIADDDDLLRGALADLINSAPELELLGSAIDADQAIELVCEKHPDAAVVDVKMPAGGGARAARGIQECSPETRIIAYSGHDDRAIVLEMLSAGATSYLLKGAQATDVVDTLVRAARGEAVLSPEITGGVVAELALHVQQREVEQEQQRELTDRIRRTIDEQRFEVVFQPIVDLASGDVLALEALTRFSDEPVQGPDRWFADAKLAGMLVELELSTARVALDRLGELPPTAYMTFNLSPETVPHCQSLVDGAGAERLVIELTEHAAIDDYEELSPHLKKLRTAGTRLAVDDAGAGFASLRHTLQLAPDFIKLDLSLTTGIDCDRGRRALAAGLIGFAHELNADIIAEGIETRGELLALRALEVRYGQGYYLAAPGPLP
jgi:EAL domain-containing protein (putative c-di-GMP-specific phosphodiesterase class I)/DNA-binding NarL/FixJ family response regulator